MLGLEPFLQCWIHNVASARHSRSACTLQNGVLTRACSVSFVIHVESIPEDRSVVESSAVDIEGGEGKSVCMASLFSEGQHHTSGLLGAGCNTGLGIGWSSLALLYMRSKQRGDLMFVVAGFVRCRTDKHCRNL